MKIKLTYKTPDVIDYALDAAHLEGGSEEREDIYEIVREVIGNNEYVIVEVDTEVKTATVIKHRY